MRKKNQYSNTSDLKIGLSIFIIGIACYMGGLSVSVEEVLLSWFLGVASFFIFKL
ncbi:hypothetical protein ACFL0C_01960 [Patescibacteria group bacterium]